MKRNILFQLFALGLLLQLAGCQIPDAATGEEDTVFKTGQWLAYGETQCADPWGYCNTTPDKKVCVKEYVEKQGFTVMEITETQENLEMVCKACTCPTGRTFKVKVGQQEVSKLLAAGFKKL